MPCEEPACFSSQARCTCNCLSFPVFTVPCTKPSQPLKHKCPPLSTFWYRTKFDIQAPSGPSPCIPYRRTPILRGQPTPETGRQALQRITTREQCVPRARSQTPCASRPGGPDRTARGGCAASRPAVDVRISAWAPGPVGCSGGYRAVHFASTVVSESSVTPTSAISAGSPQREGHRAIAERRRERREQRVDR